MFDDIIQKKRKLRVRWTVDPIKELKAYYSFNATEEITDFMAQELENDEEIIEYTTIREEGKGTLIDTIRGSK